MNLELAADFEWFKCPQGHRVANAKDVARARGDNPDTYPDEDWIIENSNNRILYRCPMDDTSLVTVFAYVETPRELIRFANQFGLMADTTWGGEYSVANCLRHAQRFRELLLCKEKGPRKVAALYQAQMEKMDKEEAPLHQEEKGLTVPEWGDLSRQVGIIDLIPDLKRGVRLRLEAETLVGAMLWQLGLKLSGATGFRECRQCGKPFEAGPGTKVRADSTFCCPEHSVLFHSRRRSKGKLKNA